MAAYRCCLLILSILIAMTCAIDSSEEEATLTAARDCAEIQSSLSEQKQLSGPYIIAVGSGKRRVQVSCDMITDGGGWTFIQRRVDGSVSFRKSWNEYANGFGDPLKNFWIGNKYLHSITAQKRYVLRIELHDWQGNMRYAEYSDFEVGTSACKYELIKIGKYCGDAGDSLTHHVGRKFSTYDQDNDVSSANCAVLFKGAWWYADCHASNLNGEYKVGGTHTTYADGINWLGWKGHQYSHKFAYMKIRPYDF